MRIIVSSLFLLIAQLVLAQDSDTTMAPRLSLDEVLTLVKAYHPIVKQASLQSGFAEAEIRAAKGSLDPKIVANYDKKQFKGKEYYDVFSSALKVPLWFPIDPKVEVFRNEGEFLNEERYISESTNHWQVATGLSIPIGKGLFIDERRSVIKQANLYTDLAEAEQVKQTNKILLTIVKNYWEWYFSYQKFVLMQQSQEIAGELFRRIRLDFTFGEASAVDTVQALITLQNRNTDFEKSKLSLTKTNLALSVHLWGSNDVPIELANNTVPKYEDSFGVVPSVGAIDDLLVWASTNHPEIQKLTAKKSQLEIEERWNKESLKPELNLSYSILDAPIKYDGFSSPDWNNYKLGVDFSIPLFLRKERGKLQKTKLYIESTNFSLSQMQQEIAAEIRSSYAELITSQILATQYKDMARNYQRLLDAEIFNIENGESDLFKLNIQQDKYLEAQRKYFDADLKYQKLKATLPYVIGLTNLSYE